MATPGYRDEPTAPWDSSAPVDLAEAEDFLRMCYAENPKLGSVEPRLAVVRAQVGATGTYVHTPDELAYCRSFKDPMPHLAARFAAKEAASKALGTGIAGGVSWTQIEVVQPGGRVPTLRLSGVALERFQSMGARKSHLTISHDGGLGVACVVLED